MAWISSAVGLGAGISGNILAYLNAGDKPKVPSLPSTTLPQQQGQAIAANQAALPGSENLASSSNLFNEQQIQQMLAIEFPGASKAAGNISSNITSETAGQLPADVSQAVWNSGAAQALGLGVGGSGEGANLVAKDLGLTSLQLTEQGLSDAEGWMKTSAALFEPSMVTAQSMFITPEQQYQATNEQNVENFQRNWMTNQIAAMPDPGMAVLSSQLQQYGGSTVGGFGGGGGGAATNWSSMFGGGNGGSSDSGGGDFAWSSGTSDMFDNGFDYGGAGSAIGSWMAYGD